MKRTFEKIIAIAFELFGPPLRHLNSDSRKYHLKDAQPEKEYPLTFLEGVCSF